MMFDGVYLPAVVYAALLSFGFGATYYRLLAGPWRRAAGLTQSEAQVKWHTLLLTFACKTLMAFVLAGVIYHTAAVTPRNGIISALMIWAGFMVMGLIINHRHQKAPWALTVINAGHWLGVLVIQGAAYGYFAAT